MKFQRGDLVDVVGKVDGRPWGGTRGIISGFFFGPTQDLFQVTVLESKIAMMRGRSYIFSQETLQLVEAG